MPESPDAASSTAADPRAGTATGAELTALRARIAALEAENANLAADGAFYWVLAHVTPTFDAQKKITGYHSNRRSPERAAVQAAEDLYQQMIEVERRHQRPADAIEASCALLDQRLTDAGKTYEQWVWSLDASEGAR